MDKFERALPEPERRAYREKKRAEGYAVNGRTMSAIAGLNVFAAVGAVMLINAVLRLLACAWVFTFEGHDLTRAGLGFSLATLCFIAALLCRRGFDYCHRTLQRHVRPE
ncbi:hypothetical protein ABEH06_24080 [Pantoea agglomerans]|uniref:hypothetical protein n=1 Tax=Enterobacter agglomerans TaxID=549 RepID=UPI00320A9454